MDGLFDLALSPQTLPLSSMNFSAAELSEREDLLRLGDSELVSELLGILQSPSYQAQPSASTPVSLSELSLLGQWGDVYSKAINHVEFLAWADRQQLDFATLRVRLGTLTGNNSVTATHHRFTLADESGWWKVANPITFIAQLLDPAELGMPYLGHRTSNATRQLSLDRVLAFYGYPLPANRLQTQVIVEELSAADAFPSIDHLGRNRSLIHGERLSQQLDFAQLADALQALTPFEGFALFSTRLHLTSGSLLSRTLKEAAQHLKLIIEDDGDEGVSAASGLYYFDPAQRAICVLPTLNEGTTQTHELRPENPGIRWHTLQRLADKLATRIYPDHSLSLAACMQVYGIERVTTADELTALVACLRQWPMPPTPTLYAAARSLDERYIYTRFIGVLNDRYSLRHALFKMVSAGVLNGPQGLDAIIPIDADTLPTQLLPGRRQLQALVDHPEFVAILVQQRIAPTSHVLLSVEKGIGAKDVDGHWKSLSTVVMANAKLAPMVRLLATVATQLGGELRTNDAISLRQALRLYAIPLPASLEAARLSARRRVISLPHPLYESNYWRALSPAMPEQPIGWTLSEPDRQQVIATSRQFLPDADQSLFSYLCGALLRDKSPVDIRAEADLLMSRLIASPLAQQLARQLVQAVQWQGSEASDPGGHAGRSALLWAALILSLDPDASLHATRINGMDWAAPYFWGESVAFVRRNVETSFRSLDRGAAALAAHLMLCGQAPYLLVRDIPDTLPFLCTQTWVLFQQYATYLEQRLPGGARQMSHDEMLYLAYLPPHGKWSLFLDSAHATPAILAWAAANGIVPRSERYSVNQMNLAIAELNSLRARLRTAEEAFTAQVPTQRSVALEVLKKVYPQVDSLENLVWEWSAQDEESAALASLHAGRKYAFVDLYMANELVASSTHWQSSDVQLKYATLAPRFVQLAPFNQVLAPAFDAHLNKLQSAYVDYLCSALPARSLDERETLEFGKVECFALRSAAGAVGAFGLIVCASFYKTRHVYECFPKYLLLRRRRDLAYSLLVNAVASDSQTVADLAVEWPAYATGAEPSTTLPATRWPDLRIGRLDTVLAEIEVLPPADAKGHRIPRSLDSTRSRALAALITGHYLQEGSRLLAQARLAQTLEQISSGNDPWADYLLSMSLAAK
ncbi:hypothetical protein BFW87_28400 [Pseudomonas fluorescens]|uniref:Uncharacterized protein n=1 Tax=Pseudomonas fluorescens TaxID=294 RepID=A0A1T2XXR8_PSEFL|nr:hypothetical protein [Pseudomonas fluorescens]OPA84654.1 hypothetical protein BFW87_28400 [Pseudomonas fluorescens]